MTDARPLHELADEYVVGLLEPEEQRDAGNRAETDAAFRAALAASRDRFLELDLITPPAAIPDGLWDRIADGLEKHEKPGPARSAQPGKQAANQNQPMTGWRSMALGGLAASLLLAVGLGWSLMSRPEPKVIAVLVNAQGDPLVLVEDFGNRQARITPLDDFDVPAGKTMQVWTLPSQDLGPVSLGLLETARTATLDGPVLPEPKGDQLYEITIEDDGGSPTGRPTGPILVKGLAKLPR